MASSAQESQNHTKKRRLDPEPCATEKSGRINPDMQVDGETLRQAALSALEQSDFQPEQGTHCSSPEPRVQDEAFMQHGGGASGDMPESTESNEDQEEATRQQIQAEQSADPGSIATVEEVHQAASNVAGVIPGAHEQREIDPPTIYLDDLKYTQEFIDALKRASLDEGDLDAESLHRLRYPLTHTLDLSDRHLRLSIDLFLAVSNASQETYNSAREAILRCYPDDADKTSLKLTDRDLTIFNFPISPIMLAEAKPLYYLISICRNK
ncbi:hypothetical protein BV22DRAFT_1036129 [Leucogyrophana mollusca]|uniref:Uncharacterized protein n=1 Tax=Leucogyrophana mollusca TaxID=85980 RepID=A0ACB8BE71_9AGAM|nr:hypothetical protein BV22DRAFT_1036129 [Leucogyrophana mollusca]